MSSLLDKSWNSWQIAVVYSWSNTRVSVVGCSKKNGTNLEQQLRFLFLLLINGFARLSRTERDKGPGSVRMVLSVGIF
jgi:hypothetical protein